MTFLDKVLEVAKNDDSVRLVVMNGSRVNPNIIPDGYQDYDIVFYVDNYHVFLKDLSFISKFGEILVKQTTDDQRDGFETIKSSFIYMTPLKYRKKIIFCKECGQLTEDLAGFIKELKLCLETLYEDSHFSNLVGLRKNVL